MLFPLVAAVHDLFRKHIKSISERALNTAYEMDGINFQKYNNRQVRMDLRFIQGQNGEFSLVYEFYL